MAAARGRGAQLPQHTDACVDLAMHTIYRALVTAVLLVWGYVIATGLSAGESPEALETHLTTGLVGALFGALVQSLPFAYFLGTGFWVKAFVRASGADADWETRQKGWMKSRGYLLLYVPPVITLATAITGGMAETGRVPVGLHASLVLGAFVVQLAALFVVPQMMVRNSALMDELAETHSLPKPDTPELDEYIEREEANALPPLFQLSRVLMFFGIQPLLIWLYLRFGTEGLQGAPYLPFALFGCALFALGFGLNARHDPEQPATQAKAITRAMIAAGIGLVLFVALPHYLSDFLEDFMS